MRPYGAFPNELKEMRELSLLWWNTLSPKEKAEVPTHTRPPGTVLTEPGGEGDG